MSLTTVAIFLLELSIRLGLAAAILVRSRGTPATRLTWLVVVLSLPVLGVVVYLLIGETRLGRRRLKRHRAIVKRLAVHHGTFSSAGPPVAADIPDEDRQIAFLAESVGGNHTHGGHELRLFGDTDLFIQALVEDIDAAQRHCHLLFYIFLEDHSGRRVAEALVRAAERGVACRLLVDAVGSRDFLRSRLRGRLDAARVQVVDALPASVFRMLFARLDIRNHRKIAVIDGEVGYAGSQNIADAAFAPKPRFAPWVDAMVRIRGPVVRDLQVVFVQDWLLDTNDRPDESLEEVLAIAPPFDPDGAAVQVIGTGPDAYNEAMLQMVLSAFHAAREELIVTTPYFVPDQATESALYTTACRGVDVSLVVPARNDSPLVAAASRSYYERLLDSGASIYEYRRGLLHAKTITIDRRLSMVTTANIDRRSFELNFEVSMVVYDSDFSSELRLLQRSYIDDSTLVDADAWRKRGWPKRLWQNALGMLSPLL